jgi:hypothetical protein
MRLQKFIIDKLSEMLSIADPFFHRCEPTNIEHAFYLKLLELRIFFNTGNGRQVVVPFSTDMSKFNYENLVVEHDDTFKFTMQGRRYLTHAAADILWQKNNYVLDGTYQELRKQELKYDGTIKYYKLLDLINEHGELYI